MNVKSPDSPSTWVDPDDAPELTDEFLATGTWQIGDKVVTREEALLAARLHGEGTMDGANKVSTTIKVDADVLAAFKATGQGWQTRMGDALKEWISTRER
jgi:uncharacterized protein (DUF4415 family)